MCHTDLLTRQSDQEYLLQLLSTDSSLASFDKQQHTQSMLGIHNGFCRSGVVCLPRRCYAAKSRQTVELEYQWFYLNTAQWTNIMRHYWTLGEYGSDSSLASEVSQNSLFESFASKILTSNSNHSCSSATALSSLGK